jgi:hypothetical protein
MMQFAVLDYHLQQCERHLDATGARNTEVEYYLVQYLLVRICAEYEQRIRLMVRRRCSRIRDEHLKRLIDPHLVYVTKRYSFGDINNLLGRFGPDYQDAFANQFVNQQPQTAWTNIYTNRQAVAHKAGVQMSFGDLQDDYKASLAVLDALAVALGLRTSETRSFK